MSQELYLFDHGVKLRPPTASRSYYRLDYYLGGLRRQPSVGKDFDRAVKEAERAVHLVAADTGEVAELPFTALIDEWQRVNKPFWSDNYTVQVEDTMRRFLIPTLGNVRCCDLTRAHIRRAIDLGSTRDVRRVNRNVTSSLIGWGCAERWISTSADILIPPKERNAPSTRVQFISLDQTPERADVLALAAAVVAVRLPKNKHGRIYTPDPNWALMVLLAAFCGLRQGEVFALRGTDIKDGVVTISRQVQEIRGKGLVESPPKGKRARRVPIPTQVGEWKLHALVAERAAEVGGGLLFPAPRGGYFRKSGFNKRVLAPAIKVSGYKWTFHSLRHHFCRWLLAMPELDAKDVSLMAGHKSVSTTLDLYVGHEASTMERARKAMG